MTDIMASYRQKGEISGALIATVCLIVALVLVSGLSIWLYVQYSDAKNNVDNKVALAKADAAKEQADTDNKAFQEERLKDTTDFVGPDDYGRVTFKYPKIWSVYVDKDASKGGDYAAYINPGVVPPVSPTQQFAVRVTITSQSVDQQLKKYESLVKKGDLKSSAISVNGQSGTRLDGSFTKNIRGSAVFFKVRDKTLVVQTDLSTSAMQAAFNALVKTITFNT